MPSVYTLLEIKVEERIKEDGMNQGGHCTGS